MGIRNVPPNKVFGNEVYGSDSEGFGMNPSSNEFRLCNIDEWRSKNHGGRVIIRGYSDGGDMVRHRNSSVADPFPKPNEYNTSDVAKLREVIIALRKPRPSLLYVDGLSYVWNHVGHAFSLKDPKGKVVTMAEFLQLPNFKVAADLPPKTRDMVRAELPCRKVLDDKEKKKRKAEAKAAVDAPGADTQAKKVVRDKEDVQENVDVAFANEGHGNNKGGISSLQTQSPSLAPLVMRVIPMDVSSAYDEKMFAYDQLSKNYDGPLTQEKILQDRLEELEDEKKETEQLNSEQERYAVKAGNGEMRSLGEAFSLAIAKGIIDGISIGCKDSDIHAILKATPNVNPASSDIFMETNEKLFEKRYPYVDKVARMYLLDPSGLQNVMPDETGPTPSRGPRDTPTALYA
ncbi:hypothetical protein Tco_0264756 [Tanacetum coccineum]